MERLINTIRDAVAEGATAEAKARGADACRTILAALDTEPGQPLPVAAPAQPAGPPPGVPMTQVLDALIGRLKAELPASEPESEPERRPARLEIPFVPIPNPGDRRS